MHRTTLSRPLQLALSDGVLTSDDALYDHGCGRGGDVKHLADAGVKAFGWDPVHAPNGDQRHADVVNLGYVLNVIESPDDRRRTLGQAWSYARRALIVAARPAFEAGAVTGRPHGDGILTSKGTFQKFFEQDELRAVIESTTGATTVAAAPGIFYVFRNAADAAGVKARRFRYRKSAAPRLRVADRLWDEHRDLLEPLALFWEERGRLPEPWELPRADEIEATIGSLRRAAGVLRRVLGEERFHAAASQAADHLLVFLALEAFGGRPRFSDLPDDVQLDVRALFGSYKKATEEADALLFSMADEALLDETLRSIPFGKVLPDAVYVHADYVSELPPLIRVYEGSGRALLGEVEDTTLVKLSRRVRRISYLSYPTFEGDPHPALATSLRVDLRSFHVKWRDFRESENPPVLHRKETFVPDEHPTREKFAKLTTQEERAGLFEESSRIGTRRGWQEALDAAGRTLRGHRLVTSRSDQ